MHFTKCYTSTEKYNTDLKVKNSAETVIELKNHQQYRHLSEWFLLNVCHFLQIVDDRKVLYNFCNSRNVRLTGLLINLVML